MKFFIPSEAPELKAVIRNVLKVCVYDAWNNPNIKAYGFAKACKEKANTYIIRDEVFAEGLKEQWDFYSFSKEIASYVSQGNSEAANDRLAKIFQDEDSFSLFLNSYCEDYGGSLKGWLGGTTKTITKSFEASIFFTYLMICQAPPISDLKEYFEKTFSALGISEVNTILWDELLQISRNTTSQAVSVEEQKRSSITLGIINYSLFASAGETESRFEKCITALHNYLDNVYTKEISAETSLSIATESWFKDVNHFEPRSISITGVSLQQFYIHPLFTDGLGNASDPLDRLINGKKSQRMIIQAKTGMGKTIFLRMLALCLANNQIEHTITDSAFQRIAASMSVPSDSYVIFIPARMFSFCYENIKYRNWTMDLIDLFFNSIFKLSAAYNFFSGNNPQRYSISPAAREYANNNVTPELKNRIFQLAQAGKLILLADSFDEIVPGEMRKAYLKAISKFCNDYCQFPEDSEIGAHVLTTSREMSPETMGTLANAMLVDFEKSLFMISPLTHEKQRELILNWGRYFREDISEIEEMIVGLSSNHFCTEFAENPYMLSVLCAKRGVAYDKITQDFINSLILKTRTSYKVRDEIVYDILQGQNLMTVLQNIALKTIENNSPHFSSRDLEKQFRVFISDDDLSSEQISDIMQQLHEVFVIAVGLIVPADGEDYNYQFINDQIRYYLAAKGIRRELGEYEGRSTIYQNILTAQGNVDAYVGLLIPLLSDMKDNSDPELAEMLIIDLVLRESTEKEEPVLIRAMIDLILGRYGYNVTTPNIIGRSDSGRITRRTQKLLIMRLFSSPQFKPSQDEKKTIPRSSAYIYANRWINTNLRKILED